MTIAARPASTQLFGRDDLLALGGRRLAAAADGSGGLLFLAGEAGIGKTRILRAIEDRAAVGRIPVVRGMTYPRDLEVGAAVFLDLARSIAHAAGFGDAGRHLSRRLGRTSRRDHDANRRRRLLILDAAEAIANLGDQGPILVSLEDLHWADDLSLEILAAVAPRLPSVPILVVGTYRSDELFPRIPMRTWRARLLNARLAEEARLSRLSLEDTAALTTSLLGSEYPAPRDLVAAIHDRSDGVPLHVEELLAATIGTPGGPSRARAADVPETLDEAILERIDQLTTRARVIAEAGAVIGRSFDLELLAAVVGADNDRLAPPLDELGNRFVLYRSPVSGRFVFKHALICDAVYQHIPIPRRRRIHARIAEIAASHPGHRLSDAELSQHLEEAGRGREAYAAAVAGARAAAAISSHHEAFELYERAHRNRPPDLSAAERAREREEYGLAAATADLQAVAAGALAEAYRAYLDAGLPVEAAGVLPPLVAARHLLGDDLETRAARLREGLALLDGAPAGAAVDHQRATLLASLAAAYMLDRRLDESLAYGEEARRLASTLGLGATELDALATIGVDLAFGGRMEEGWTTLLEAIHRGRSADLEPATARAYRMLATSASDLCEYQRGEAWLHEGIDYAERVERWNDRHYMATHLAHVLWATGRWRDAEEVARHALADGRGGITTRVTALYVLGYVALGRSDWTHARGWLDEARAIGEQMRELQRLSPALWGLAEMAALRGNHADARELTVAGRDASARVSDVAYLVPFLVTGTRARLRLGDVADAAAWVEDVGERLGKRSVPGTVPAIRHAQGLLALATGATGRARQALREAHDGWTSLARSWEGIAAALDLGTAELRGNRPAEAARLGSAARSAAIDLPSPTLVRRADEILRSARARHPTDDPWAPLTSREWEVSRLVAAGRTNAVIAEELAISRRTVSAHVEHILAKLGAARRSEIAAWVATVQGTGGRRPPSPGG
jgi:DNA-binding CsgD family transcriptional regulator